MDLDTRPVHGVCECGGGGRRKVPQLRGGIPVVVPAKGEEGLEVLRLMVPAM